MVLFTSRSLSHLGETLRCLIWCLHQVFICYLLSINYILLYTYNMMTDYAFLLQGSDRWGKDLALLWWYLNISPSLQQFHIMSITQSELSSLTSLKVWGDKEKFHNDIAFLLVSAEEEVTGDRKYGLSTIWVNPCQARVCSMEEVVKELTAWVSSGPDWPYTLVWLNKDTHHAPLPKEGHLGMLPERGTDSMTCRRISQLEVHQLLISGLQVAYLLGLNGHEDPIITSLAKSLAHGISLTGGRSIHLEVNIPQPIAEELDWKVLPPGRCSPILMASPLKTTPPKLEREVSMTMEVRSLLSWVMLDTSGQVSGNSTPERPNPVVILTPPPHKLRDPSGPVDTSSQVSAPDDVEMAEASLEEVPTNICPIAKTPGSRSSTPPADASHLWEKANKALEELLATKSSIDAHRWKVVWELGMELWQNDSKTTESFKETKAICTCATLDAEALCSATFKEAKSTCAHTIWEAKALCSTAIRDVETWGASQADSLQWRHAKTIQHLEEQVIQEEGKSQIDFLSACQAALQANPVEFRGTLVASYHILMGRAPSSNPFTLLQGAFLYWATICPSGSSFSCAWPFP